MKSRQMERYDIAITRADAGGFTYSPSTLNVASGDEVSWSSTLGPFAVSFRDATPLPVVTVSSTAEQRGEACYNSPENQEVRSGASSIRRRAGENGWACHNSPARCWVCRCCGKQRRLSRVPNGVRTDTAGRGRANAAITEAQRSAKRLPRRGRLSL